MKGAPAPSHGCRQRRLLPAANLDGHPARRGNGRPGLRPPRRRPARASARKRCASIPSKRHNSPNGWIWSAAGIANMPLGKARALGPRPKGVDRQADEEGPAASGSTASSRTRKETWRPSPSSGRYPAQPDGDAPDGRGTPAASAGDPRRAGLGRQSARDRGRLFGGRARAPGSGPPGVGRMAGADANPGTRQSPPRPMANGRRRKPGATAFPRTAYGQGQCRRVRIR